MSPFQRRSPAFRAIAVLLLVAPILPGCTTWRPPGQPIEPLLAGPNPPKEVLVKLRDGTKLYLKSPYVAGDSLYGQWDRHSRSKEPLKAMALADVQAIEISKANTAETVGLILVLGGLAAIVIAMASMDDILSGAGQ